MPDVLALVAGRRRLNSTSSRIWRNPRAFPSSRTSYPGTGGYRRRTATRWSDSASRPPCGRIENRSGSGYTAGSACTSPTPGYHHRAGGWYPPNSTGGSGSDRHPDTHRTDAQLPHTASRYSSPAGSLPAAEASLRQRLSPDIRMASAAPAPGTARSRWCRARREQGDQLVELTVAHRPAVLVGGPDQHRQRVGAFRPGAGRRDARRSRRRANRVRGGQLAPHGAPPQALLQFSASAKGDHIP